MSLSYSDRKYLGRCCGLLAVLLLGACAAPPEQVGETQPAPAQAQEQLDDSNATLYLQLAQQSSGSQRQEHLLTAAAVLVQEGRIERAKTTLASIDPAELSIEKRLHYQLIQARIALAELQPQNALQQLRTTVTPLPSELAVEWHELRAEAYAMAGNHTEVLRERIQLEAALGDDEARQQNRQQLWQSLNRLSNEAMQALRSAPPPDVLSGWLDLGLLYRQAGATPALLRAKVATWRKLYPSHPAIGPFLDELLGQPQADVEQPRRIALLLPLSGAFAAPAKAVRDGFIAAYYSRNDSAYTPDINIYDTTDNVNTGLSVYQQAVAAGAEIIVGPLHKPLLDALAQQTELPVKTLALNYLANEGPSPKNLYQYGLLPEDEARQVAERAWLDGHSRALVLVPEGEWGDRMLTTFTQQWRQLGGKVLESQRYDAGLNDFSAPVINLLNIDESKQRGRDLQRLLGGGIKYESRRRQDVDFIFLAAYPGQARQIRPQLKFYYASAVPVYGTSHLFSGESNSTQDRDMDGILFCDMPWVLQGGSGQAPNWQSISDNWPNAAPLKRLYAMGIDAYRLIGNLEQMTADINTSLAAETGNLYLDRNGRFHRQLRWARFTAGVPQVIEATQAEAADTPL